MRQAKGLLATLSQETLDWLPQKYHLVKVLSLIEWFWEC